MLEMLDWGFFADVKQWLKNSALGNLATNKVMTFIDFLQSILQIISFYWDLFKDLATYSIFNHMSTTILVSTKVKIYVSSIKLTFLSIAEQL